jgi:hypothetical protein
MLTGGTDQIYRDMLATQPIHYVRVEVWRGGKQLDVLDEFTGLASDDGEDSVVILPGSQVSGTLQSAVARNCVLQLPGQYYPENDGDLLDPVAGSSLRCWRGILPADGYRGYIWQAFQGRIQDAEIDDQTGNAVITAADPGQDVLDAGFIRPENSVKDQDRISEMQRLIAAAVQDARFGTSDSFKQKMPALTWEFNLGAALDEMFSSVGGLWYCLANGDYVARKYPWANPGEPIMTLADGDGGVILGTKRRRSRTGMYNSITATGERLNGDDPITQTAQDTNPASPTYIGGNFGRRQLLMRRVSATTAGGVLSAAQARLRTGITPSHQWAWAQVPDASMELGDIYLISRLTDNGQRQSRVQVVQSFTLPLDLSTPMQVQGRAQVIGAIQEGGFTT